jgi:hypothetical protein
MKCEARRSLSSITGADLADVLPSKLGTQPVINVGHIGSHGDDVGGSQVDTRPELVADHALHQIWLL